VTGDAAVPPSADARIAFLEGRVEALESALRQRSRELRLLQAVLCDRDLVALARVAAGLTPEFGIAHQPELWRETLVMEVHEVEDAMQALWSSLRPVAGEPPPSP
jgi:hypothetical protein